MIDIKAEILGLNKVAEKIQQANASKGFWDKPRNIGELLMLVTSELGEAMEAHRHSKFADVENFDRTSNEDDEWFKKNYEENIKDTFQDEVADAVIRLLDMAGGLNIDLEKHILNKVRYNSLRPRLHGKKY